MEPEEVSSEREGMESGQHSPLVKKRKAEEGPTISQKKKVLGIDEEANESGEEDNEGGSGEDDDDSVDEDNNYKYNDFVVPDDAKDTDESDDDDLLAAQLPKTKLKKLKKAKGKLQLDEDDLRLIEENNDKEEQTNVSDEDEDIGDDGEIAPQFVDDSESNAIDAKESQRRPYFDGEYEDDSDMEGFIDHDGMSDGENETEEERLQRQRAMSQRRAGKRDGPSYDQIREAMDIFGAGYDSGFDDDAEPVDDLDADELGESADLEGEEGAAKLSTKDKNLINKLRSRYERSQLVASFCTDRDEDLRKIDVPERFQNIMKGRDIPDDEERAREAVWMSEKLAIRIIEDKATGKKGIYGPDLPLETLKSELIEPIQYVLKFFQVDRLEVPFVWLYRRDYLHSQMIRSHLWYLLDLDEKWESLFIQITQLQQTITALNDAAVSSVEQDEAETTKVSAEVEQQTSYYNNLLAEVEEAEQREKDLMDYIDDNENHTQQDRDNVTEATDQLEALRAKVEPVQEDLRKIRENAEILRQRILRKAKYSPLAAKEVMRLFPKDRYSAIMEMLTDEVELRDITRFLSTLMQGAEVNDLAGRSQLSNTQHTDFESGIDLTQSNTEKSRRNNISKKGEYAKYKNIPEVRKFAEFFCHPICELGDCVRFNIKNEPPATGDAFALEIALQFVDDRVLKTEQQVIKAASIVIATELSVEPNVRRVARTFFKNNASVSTSPTEKGVAVITPFSEYFGIHYLDRKPLNEFYEGKDRTLFIRLMEAQKLGLINVTVGLPQTMKNDGSFMVDTKDIFLPLAHAMMPSPNAFQDSNLQARKSWDTIRLNILELCIDKYLLPALENEYKRDLLRVGKEAIVDEAAANFEKMLQIGPYVVPNQDTRAYVAEMLRSCPNRPSQSTVMSIYQSNSGNDPLFMAFVNKDGVLKSHDLLPQQAQNQKMERIKKFVLENKPDVIVLNASAGYASRSLALSVEKNILKEVGEIIEQQYRIKMEENKDLQLDEEDGPFVPYKAEVLIVKDDIANIFKGSSRAKASLPELQPGGAAAVCLARFIQEPLSEYCNIWTSANAVELFGYEAFFLDVHPLKNLLQGSKGTLLKTMEYKLVDAVCDVGVDINKVVAMDHHGAMLAFISGLGLRKADALRQNVRRTLGTVVSRNALLIKKLLGKNVWANSAGFLKVSDNGQDNAILDPLDNTRIHPECYVTFDFAPKICADALEVDNNPADYVDIVLRLMKSVRRDLEKRIKKHPRWLDLWANHVKPIDGITEFNEKIKSVDGTEHPLTIELLDNLSQLLLEEFAEDLEAQNKGKRRLQLEHIKDELRFPWLDLRKSVRGIDANDFFGILTGETDASLHVGLKLGCTVVEISDSSFFDEKTNTYKRRQRAMVKTDNGLRGYISVYDAFDTEQQYFDFDSVNLSKYVQVGMHILAVVIGIKKDKLQVDLSIKPSHLASNEAWWLERRNSDRHMKEWWDNVKGGHAFDSHFKEREALDKFTTVETNQNKRSEIVGAQMSNVSISNAFGSDKTGSSTNRINMRMVHHPLFANLDFKATEDRMRLEGKGAGEVIIRPSSKGPDYLTITWAFQANWYKHISVSEKGKRPGDLGLGTQLSVMEADMTDVYSDLDEIHARYIEPMNDFVTTMVQHRNFMSGSVEEVEAEMRQQLSERPTRIPYFIRFEPTRPGAFVLTWMSLNAKSEAPVKKELIEVRPYGYKMRTETFNRPSDLVIWFKNTTENAAAAAIQSRQLAQQKLSAVAPRGFDGDGQRRPSRFNPIDRSSTANVANGANFNGQNDYNQRSQQFNQQYPNQNYH